MKLESLNIQKSHFCQNIGDWYESYTIKYAHGIRSLNEHGKSIKQHQEQHGQRININSTT